MSCGVQYNNTNQGAHRDRGCGVVLPVTIDVVDDVVQQDGLADGRGAAHGWASERREVDVAPPERREVVHVHAYLCE